MEAPNHQRRFANSRCRLPAKTTKRPRGRTHSGRACPGLDPEAGIRAAWMPSFPEGLTYFMDTRLAKYQPNQRQCLPNGANGLIAR